MTYPDIWTETETRYAEIEKELLAGAFAAMKFHDFINGHTATIEADHKPLITTVKKPLHPAPAFRECFFSFNSTT